MQLPLPIHYEGVVYTHVELKGLKSSDFGAIAKSREESTIYYAILEILKGGIKAFIDSNGDSNDELSEKSKIIRQMPWASAEYLSIEILAKEVGDRKMSTVFNCPLCGTTHKHMKTRDNDTRDSLDDLEIVYMDEPYNEKFEVIFDNPVDIMSKKKELVMSIPSVVMRYPTMNDIISGAVKHKNDRYQAQMETYAIAVEQYGDKKAESGYASMYGVKLMNELDTVDLRKISSALKKYGRKTTLLRTCQCGNEWDERVNLESFFALGLRDKMANL